MAEDKKTKKTTATKTAKVAQAKTAAVKAKPKADKKVASAKVAPKKVAVTKKVAEKVVKKSATPKTSPTKAVKAQPAKASAPVQKTVVKKAVAPKPALEKTAVAQAKTTTKTASKKAPVKATTTQKTIAKKVAKAPTSKAAASQKTLSTKPAAQTNKTTKPSVKKASATKAVAAKPKSTATAKSKTANVKMAPSKKKKVTFKIHRGETVQGKFETRLEEFTVLYDDSTTILQALEDIKGEQDGSLTFRRSCRASICGSCGMFINNRSRLACKTKVRDIVNGVPEKAIPPSKEIEIAPQRNQPIIRDLAVDITAFYAKVEDIHPFVQEGPETNKNVDKTSFEQVNMVSNCIMCGSCYSDCTMMVENPKYLGPAALAKAFRFVSDPREGHKTDRLEELSEEHGIWDCTRCGMCVDSCPKDVAPMEAIVKLRSRAIAAGITDNAGARHAIAFKDDIARTGMLDESMLVLKTLGPIGALSQIGNALNLAKKGKLPLPFATHKVENVKEIQAIYDALAENPINVETRKEDTGPGAG